MRIAAALVISAILSLAWLPPFLGAQTGALIVPVRESESPSAMVVEDAVLYRASYALVIGIDNYTAGWPRLSNAVRDAQLIADELKLHGFEVTLRTDLKSLELNQALQEFFVVKGDDPEARLFLWFAGHGHSEAGEGFLVPADASRADDGIGFKLMALPLRRFGEYVRLARSKHVYAVFDSCFSGTIFESQRALPPRAITRVTQLPVRQFLSAGDADQTVFDNGTFRELFIRALRGEDGADANLDGYLTASEIGLYMSDRVANLTRTRQTPRFGKLLDKDFDRGDFVFKSNSPTAPALAAVPAAAPGGATRAGTAPGASGDEIVFWQAIQTSRDPAEFEEYLKQFPDGRFAGLARRRLEALRQSQPPSGTQAVRQPGGSVAVVAPPAAPAQARPAVALPQRALQPGETFKECPACPEMVVVPAGSFTMGSPRGDPDWSADEAQRSVTIAKPFALGRYEVTRGEYAQFVRETGHRSPGGCDWQRPSFSQTDAEPVVCVTWRDAKAYIEWLSRATGASYRLPSEAEWEYAARAGTTTIRPWGDDPNLACAHANVGDLRVKEEFPSWPVHDCTDPFLYTAPVGSFPANGFGLHDMLGNVTEWVEDCYAHGYKGVPTDGTAWNQPGCRQRMIRGGAWSQRPELLRSAARMDRDRDWKEDNNGFRVARTLP